MSKYKKILIALCMGLSASSLLNVSAMKTNEIKMDTDKPEFDFKKYENKEKNKFTNVKSEKKSENLKYSISNIKKDNEGDEFRTIKPEEELKNFKPSISTIKEEDNEEENLDSPVPVIPNSEIIVNKKLKEIENTLDKILELEGQFYDENDLKGIQDAIKTLKQLDDKLNDIEKELKDNRFSVKRSELKKSINSMIIEYEGILSIKISKEIENFYKSAINTNSKFKEKLNIPEEYKKSFNPYKIDMLDYISKIEKMEKISNMLSDPNKKKRLKKIIDNRKNEITKYFKEAQQNNEIYDFYINWKKELDTISKAIQDLDLSKNPERITYLCKILKILECFPENKNKMQDKTTLTDNDLKYLFRTIYVVKMIDIATSMTFDNRNTNDSEEDNINRNIKHLISLVPDKIGYIYENYEIKDNYSKERVYEECMELHHCFIYKNNFNFYKEKIEFYKNKINNNKTAVLENYNMCYIYIIDLINTLQKIKFKIIENEINESNALNLIDQIIHLINEYKKGVDNFFKSSKNYADKTDFTNMIINTIMDVYSEFDNQSQNVKNSMFENLNKIYDRNSKFFVKFKKEIEETKTLAKNKMIDYIELVKTASNEIKNNTTNNVNKFKNEIKDNTIDDGNKFKNEIKDNNVIHVGEVDYDNLFELLNLTKDDVSNFFNEMQNEIKDNNKFKNEIKDDNKFKNEIKDNNKFKNEIKDVNKFKNEIKDDNKFKNEIKDNNNFKNEIKDDKEFKSEIKDDKEFKSEIKDDTTDDGNKENNEIKKKKKKNNRRRKK